MANKEAGHKENSQSMPANVSTGDAVKIVYSTDSGDRDKEGTLMPRVELLKKGITVVKLTNGYNIGISNEKIKSITLVKKYEQSPDAPKPAQLNPSLPNVSVLSFGGTISSRIDYKTGGVSADYTAEDFLRMMPLLRSIANIRARKVMQLMTEDMDWHDFSSIAAAIHQEISKKDVAGVVATCGTDVMHYITAATSFFLKNLNKPVVFTASQRSIDRGSSDAFMNLASAITSAARWDGSEVVLCMHGTTNDDYCLLIRGTKVRKMHASRRDAFRPINEKPLAKVVYAEDACTIEPMNPNYMKRRDIECELDNKYEAMVAQVLAYPGQDKDIIGFYVNKGYKGIVIAATALGHVATNSQKSLIPGIKNAIARGVPVIIASQSIYGRTHPHVYTNLRRLSIEAGCTFVEDMLPEVAYIKLGYVLGHVKDIQKAKELMQKSLRGEINPRIMDDEYLN